VIPTALQIVHNAIDYVAPEKHAVLNIWLCYAFSKLAKSCKCCTLVI
jgi:hypothetical protein